MSAYLDWKVGDKVVCIDANLYDDGYDPKTMYLYGDLDGLEKDKIYTIREFYIDSYDLEICICLDEIHRELDEVLWRESGYLVRRFRKVQKRKTDISIFTEMLNKAPNQEILETC